jgi:hypothetical protein
VASNSELLRLNKSIAELILVPDSDDISNSNQCDTDVSDTDLYDEEEQALHPFQGCAGWVDQ